jgi:hypothetical protein
MNDKKGSTKCHYMKDLTHHNLFDIHWWQYGSQLVPTSLYLMQVLNKAQTFSPSSTYNICADHPNKTAPMKHNNYYQKHHLLECYISNRPLLRTNTTRPHPSPEQHTLCYCTYPQDPPMPFSSTLSPRHCNTPSVSLFSPLK